MNPCAAAAIFLHELRPSNFFPFLRVEKSRFCFRRLSTSPVRISMRGRSVRTFLSVCAKGGHLRVHQRAPYPRDI